MKSAIEIESKSKKLAEEINSGKYTQEEKTEKLKEGFSK